MLRHVKVKNFVFFEEEHSLDFQEGSSFFIGPNNSGKSSIIEAVRRCMSTSKNTTLSRPFNPDAPSTVVAFFSHGNETVVSAMIRLPELIPDEKVPVFVKIIYRCNEKTNIEMDFVKETEKTGVINRSVDLSEDQRKDIYEEVAKRNPEEFDTTTFIKVIFEAVGPLRKGFLDLDTEETLENDTVCEKNLKELVDPYVVFMFPVRGVGVLPWSLSIKVDKERVQFNHEEVQKRAEILQWFFENASDEEKERERKYYNTITNNSEIVFERDGETGDVLVRNTKAGKRKHAADSPRAISILKVPDGIFEAKHCSIILSMDQFQTVGIEEPGKGMSPQMIKRLTELILQRIEKKMIILTSHHPAVLAPWNVPRIFFFRRIHKDQKLTFKVISGTEIEKSDGKPLEQKTPRIVTSDNFASMFFSSFVVLLEGETDFLFVSTLRTLLIENEEMTREALQLKQVTSDFDIELFKIFLCSLDIVKMNGHENKQRLMKLCNILHIDHIVILDYDAVISQNEPKNATKFLEDISSCKTYEEGECTPFEKYKDIKIEENVEKLEEEGIFVWRRCGDDGNGSLEDIVTSLCKKNQSRRAIFEANNVRVKIKKGPAESAKSKESMVKESKGKRTKSRIKMFGAPEVTLANIRDVVRYILKCELDDERVAEGQSHAGASQGAQGQTNVGVNLEEQKPSQTLRLVWFLFARAMKHASLKNMPSARVGD